MGRAPCCSKVGLHRGPWTAREDALLIKYIETHGEGQWRSLPKNAGLLRCGKSCRLRWMNYLRPDIKRGNITPEEDDLIIRLHGLLGNRWSLIAGRLPGRTDNEIKNYWNTHLSKRLRGQGSEPNASDLGAEPEFRKQVNNCKRKPRNKRVTQKPKPKMEGNKNVGSEYDGNETTRTRIHVPEPVRVTTMVSLARNDGHTTSFETNMSATSASSSQSQCQSQTHGLLFDPESMILDMPWLPNDGNMNEQNGFDHLMKVGSCGDNGNLGMIHPHDRHDSLGAQDSNKQFEKLYEEYLQLIKVDHDRRGDDDDYSVELDSFTQSFLI